MLPSESRPRLVLLLISLLVVLGPALILVLTLGALTAFGDLAVGRLSLVELLELYIIELLVIGGLTYGIYRLTLWLVENELPQAVDAIEDDDGADGNRREEV